MAKGEGTKVIADSCVCTLASTGTDAATIEFDIAAEAAPFLGHGAHTTGKFTSQQYKENTMTKDGSLEATTLTVTFVLSEYKTLQDWWKENTSLTYTVNGTAAGLPNITYTDCHVRISDQPKVTPGAEGKITVSVEISTLMNIADLEAVVTTA